ncbi:MAG: rod shape-determining protein MreD [Acidiferrobacteraceae bacterium]
MNTRTFRSDRGGRLMAALTLVVALLLAIQPIPAAADPYRPDWVALCLIYWNMELPEGLGLGMGWIAGLALDVLYGTPLGEQALADSVLAFLAAGARLRFRMFPRWQQALVILVLVGTSHAIIQLMQHAAGRSGGNWSYWTSAGVSALVWPLVYPALRYLHFRTTPS